MTADLSRCPGCRSEEIISGDMYCGECGRKIDFVVFRPPGPPDPEPEFTWSEVTADSVAFHWLGQCRRHLRYPVNSTERTWIPAFEHAWRAFAYLYEPLQGRDAAARMKNCIALYLRNPDDFFRSESALISNVILSLESDQFEIEYESGYSDENTEERWRKARDYGRELSSAFAKNQPVNAAQNLAWALYQVRNARVHGVVSSAPIRRRTAGTARPLEYEPIFAISISRLCIHLLRGKTDLDLLEINEVIRSRTLQLVKEIRDAVAKW